MYLALPLMGFLLELGNGAWAGKTNWNDVATMPRKKSDDIFSRFDTTAERDRQTDGQTPVDSKDRADA